MCERSTVPSVGGQLQIRRSWVEDSTRVSMMRACLIAAVLLFPCGLGCTHSGSDASTADLGDCGADLSREEIIVVARKAMESLWGDSSLEDFDVRIEPAGCDYHFFAIRKGTEAAEDIFFSIDRSGHVNSAPECWWLGDIGRCAEEEPIRGTKEPGRRGLRRLP